MSRSCKSGAVDPDPNPAFQVNPDPYPDSLEIRIQGFDYPVPKTKEKKYS
jgi:hypothetical protein